MSATRAAELEVYTDGQCPLCLWMRAQVEARDTGHRLEWFDYHAPEILERLAPRTFKELSAQMHVRRKIDDVWFQGFAAWREVLKMLPHWRWLGRLFDFFPFTILGEPFYHFIADHRYTLFGVPPPCDAESGICERHGSKKR